MNDVLDGLATQQGVSADKAAYLAEADTLFQKIAPLWNSADNVWRTACAFDSLLDYFAASGIDTAPYADDAFNALDPTKKGNWWDDFGWIGIAALRAAESGFAANHRYEFLKIAINSWCYMHGPGWSTVAGPPRAYPYLDSPGWASFAANHNNNTGAPNCWANIDYTWPTVPPDMKAMLRPRYVPGGIWNSPFTSDDHPRPSYDYVGGGDVLNPIQNTVTNAVYALLSMRLLQAAKRPDFAPYFSKANINLAECNWAWENQIAWWQLWMLKTPEPEQSLLLTEGQGSLGGSLVRERVSTFAAVSNHNYWDSSYNKNMTWSGDQGLLIGALREAKAIYKASPPQVCSLYPDIIKGTFANYFRTRSYDSISGSFPLPWLELGAADPYGAAPPGNDYGDYQTGVGAYMRYLLQAYQAEPSLLTAYEPVITAMADVLVKLGEKSPSPPSVSPRGACDAFTPQDNGNGNADLMSAYVNRLAVLTLAIAMS